MKKLFCIILALIITVKVSAVCVQAEESSEMHEPVSFITVFGDSIPAGYGLKDYTPVDLAKAKDCFVNLLCGRYGLEDGITCMNFAHTGLTTGDVMNSVKNTSKDTLKNSDVIIISAGANDIMDVLEEALLSAFLEERAYFEENGVHIDTSDLLSYERSLFAVITEPKVKDGTARIYAACTDENNKRTYTDTILKAENNIKETISFIRETGSNAEIIILLPYNPGEIITGNPLLDTVSEMLTDYHDKISAVCDSSEYGYSTNTVDLLTEFRGQAMTLTNITALDIHPNKAGHEKIAELITSKLDTVLSERNQDKISKADKSAPYSDTAVYIILCAACAAVILILINAVIIYRRKKL